MLTGRTYIVTAPELCAAVQRASTSMGFDGIVAAAAPRVFGLNAHTTGILQDPAAKQEGRTTLTAAAHHILNPPLTPQNILGASKTQLEYLSRVIHKIEDGTELDLFRFVTHAVTLASMATFYGPNNPFEKRPGLVEAFWDWEAGVIAYAIGLLPKITARKASCGLELCVQGFEEYIERDGYKDAHILVQERNELHLRSGITDIHERARLEIAICLAFNVNASGTTFWLINNVFSRPELLSRIREEIRRNALLSPECFLRTACAMHALDCTRPFAKLCVSVYLQ